MALGFSRISGDKVKFNPWQFYKYNTPPIRLLQNKFTTQRSKLASHSQAFLIPEKHPEQMNYSYKNTEWWLNAMDLFTSGEYGEPNEQEKNDE